jgi:hypothetical protein
MSLAPAGAQMPGVPVLQNAWAMPGTVAAINFGGGSDGQAFAVAAAWAPPTGSVQLSGGAGFRNLTGLGNRSAYGLRLAIPIGPSNRALGFAAFAGLGGGSVNASDADSAASTSEVPLGAVIGWRRALDAVRGVSIYASPSYLFLSGGSHSGGLVRGAVAIDMGITRSFGLTAGIDFGQSRDRAFGGPSGVLFGAGLAYAFGHR